MCKFKIIKMGLRNCCCSNKEKEDNIPRDSFQSDFLFLEPIKPVFRINTKEKIKKADFSESYKVKRYKLKHKKRILIVQEDNTISLFSFYLGNLIFLLNSFKVNEQYKILKCCFLSKLNSTRFCLILEDIDGKVEILIIKIEKEKNTPHVELNLGGRSVKKEKLNSEESEHVSQTEKIEKNENNEKNPEKCESQPDSESEADQNLKTQKSTKDTNFSKNKEILNQHQNRDQQEQMETQDPSPSLNMSQRNKKAVESIVNSSESSDYEFESNSNNYEQEDLTEIIVLKNYDSNFTNFYLNAIPPKSAKKKFEDIIMVKYGFYKYHIKQVINDLNENVSQVIVDNDYIYLFSDQNSWLKCYKIKSNMSQYILVFSTALNFADPFTDLIFPVNKEKLFVIDGLDFVFLEPNSNSTVENTQDNIFKYKKSFKEILEIGLQQENMGSDTDTNHINHLNQAGNLNLSKVDFIKFLKVICVNTSSKLKLRELREKDSALISNFYLTGLCNLHEKINDQLQQFIAYVAIDLNEMVNSPYENANNFTNESNFFLTKSKIRIIKNIPIMTEISFGPFNNGPLLTGHVNGTLTVWNIHDLTITKVIRVFSEDLIINKLLNEPLGLSICVGEMNIVSTNLLDKKVEYYYNENENNELERVVRFVAASK